jgi:pantoate--beta-alanine ligase
MRTLRRVAEVRAALRPARGDGRSIGLVPTMGALHEGHATLIRRAREDCDEVVVSLFVNPTQFNDSGDLDAYPRDERRDAAIAADCGADLLWAPPVEEIYPPGFSSEVRLAGPIVEALEGAHRGAGHFHGVTTVVTKLLNVVQPDVAFFGQKDAQQAVVIRKLVRDLDMPARIEVVPTVREEDGLAISSRNVHLRGEDRARALTLVRALRAAEDAWGAGERDATALRAAALAPFEENRSVQLEYLELVDPTTLAPVAAIDGEVLVAVAARVGGTRLIDNTTLNGRR